MALTWGLLTLLPAYLSIIFLSILVCGAWELFSRYQNQGPVAAKRKISKQHDRRQIQKCRASKLEKAGTTDIIEATCISGRPMGWNQEYVFQSMNRSIQRILQHLENSRSSLMERSLPESRDMSSSSVSGTVVREAIPSSCYWKMRNRSSDSSKSSVSSNDSSNPSYLPIFPEGTTWQFQSRSLPAFSGKEPSTPGSQGSSLPSFQLADLGPNSVLNESPEPLVWDSLQLSPLVRGELEKHISQKVSTSRAQVLPLPVKKSWEILNHLTDVQGVPEQGLPKTQLPTLIPQSAEENINRSPDAPSFHVHVNTGVNSELYRTEVSQPLTSNKQLQSENDSQVLRHNPLILSMGTPSPMNRVQEENALLRKDPKHVVGLNIEQRVLGLPEKRTQPQRAQGTNVELTPQVPRSAKDSIKVTPVALLQVMGSMGMIPESHAQVIDCMGFPPQPPNQAETVSITPRPSDQVIEPKTVASLQLPTTESKSMASRLSQVTDNMKVSPVTLLPIMDSMGMINELHPRVIEPAGIAPKPQYQVTEPAKVDTLHGHQAIQPRDRSLGLQQSVLGTVEVIPQSQPKVMRTPNKTLGSQNQATKNIGITPGPIKENILEISSNATPGAQQTLDFMQVILPGTPHVAEPRALIKTENLTPLPTQPDFLTSTVPIGAAESRGVPPQLPSKVLESAGVIQLPSDQSLHALKVTSIGQVPPGAGTIPPLQVVDPPGLTPQPVAQVKEPLDLPSGLQGQVGDSVGMTPQHQDAEYVSLTSGLSQPVMNPSKFTPWHQDLDYSEVSPRQSHKMTETMGGTSDTWPQMKNSVEMKELPNQKIEYVITIAAPLDQGTIPIGRSQKHHVTEAEVVPVTPLLEEIEHLGENAIPQPKVMDSTNLPPDLQNVNSEHLIPDPRLQSLKSVDPTMDLVPENIKYGPLTSRAVSTDLTPELHQQSIQFEELTPMPQLQSEESVPSAPESQLQDVKSGQVIVEPQLQNIQSAGLAPDPQLQSNKSVHLTPGSQAQGMEGVVHSALSQELQGDTKMVELAPRPSLEEDKKSVYLTRKPYSQNIGFEKTAHVPLLENTKTLLVEGRSLIPEALVESVNLSESVSSTHLYVVKSLEVNPDPTYHFLEPEELALQHQVPEERVGSDICDQVEESVELTESLGMTLAPLSQTSDSTEMDSPPLQETLETRNQVVKEMEETPESQNTIKDALDLLPESEVQNMNSVVMAPEPQPPGVKFLHGTLESCLEVTNTSEITLRPEYKNRETFRLTSPKVDDTQGAMIEPHSKMGSLKLGLEPGVQGEKSESLAQHLKSAEGVGEPPVLAVEPTALTTGPKPHIKDVIPGPQLHEAKPRQMDTESQLQNVIQQSSIGEVGPEKAKPEPGPQSPSPKELIEETQPPKVKSVDLNLGPQQLSIKSGLIPGPQLQSVIFPTLYQELLLQGGKPGNFISGPRHYGVKSDEALSRSPVTEIRSSDFIPGLNLPGPKLQHVKPVEVNVGPRLQDVKFSDLIPEPKHQGFKCTQVIPGIQFQDRKFQGLTPESFLPLSQEPQVEDTKLVLPMEVSVFQSRTHTSVISEEINPELRQQDTKFSELASRLRLQGVKIGEQTPGPLFHGMRSVTPELGTHNRKLVKMTPKLHDTKQTSFNSGPWLQNGKFFDGTPGTPSQGVTTSELHSLPQLECVKVFEFTTQPARQGMKPKLIREIVFEDRKYITRNHVPRFEDKMSYKLPSEPQTPMAESMRLTPGIYLASVDHSKLDGRPQAQGIESSESIPGPHLGHIKPVEKVTASKQEELTSGPHLGDVKPMELRSKSELGKVKSIPLTPEIQAGDKEPEELPPGPNLKDLKSELLPSRPQLENKKSAVLTLGQCLERIKSPVVSPCSSQSDGIKIETLISGSTIEDMKTVGLAHDTHVQDVSAMGLKLEPKKQEESHVTFVPEIQFQKESVEVLQGPQLQSIKSKELISQSQMQDSKHVITSYLKPQNRKLVNTVKIQGIPGVKFVNLVSTQPCKGIAPTDLTLKPGQDDQITIRSPEWKSGILDQLSKQFESDDVLSMKSGQEAKPADKKSEEMKLNVQLKDTPSFEVTPEPVVHTVKPEEIQGEPQVPSMKPCQVTPGPQGHKVKVSEPTLKPAFQDVKTTVLTEPQIRSTKSVQWIPISEFQSEKWVESDFRLQSQSAKPTELKPSTQWRGVRSSELTVMSKITQEEKSVGFHLEPQTQQVKTSPLALGLQKTKSFNLTSKPQPPGIKTVDQNEDPPFGSVRSVQWIPGPEFQGVKFLGLNHGSQSQGVKSTEHKTSIRLGGVKPSETAVRPKLQGEKSVGLNLESQVHHMTPELFPEPELQKGEKVTSTSEPQPQGIKTVVQNHDPPAGSVRSIQWIPGPEFHSEKCLGLNRGSQSQDVKSTEQKPSIQLGGVKPPEMTVEPKLQGKKTLDFNVESKVQHIKTPEDTPEPESQEGENSEPQAECIKSVTLHHGSEPQAECIKSVTLYHGSEPQAECIKSVTLYHGSEPQAECIKSVTLYHGSEPQAECIKSVTLYHGSEPQAECIKSVTLHHGSEPQAECIKSVTLHHGSEPQAECIKSVTLHHGSEPQAECIKGVALHRELQLENTKSVEWIPGSEFHGVKFLGNVKTSSELTTRTKLQSKQPSGSTPEEQSHGFNTIDFKSELQFRTMKGCDPNLKINNIKFTFKPRFHLEGTGSPGLNPGMQPQEVKPLGSPPGTQPQSATSLVFKQESQASEVNYGVLSQGPQPQSNMELKSAKSSELALQTKPWGMKSEINSGPQWQSAKCSDLTPETESQNRKCITSSQGKPFVNQGVNSSACTPGQNPHSNRYNLGPLLQGMHSGTTFPTPQIMCVNPVWCSVQTHLQNVNSSACSQRQESQSANSMGYNPGPHLEAPKLQGMKFSELNPETGIQREMPITVNPGQHLQDLKLELTSGSNIARIAPAEYNPGPQEQCMNFSELNPELKLQRINLAKLGSGPQLQNIKSFAWTPGSESQCTGSALSNPEPPFQGVKPSNLMVGAKFQEIPFLKKQFGSQQQTAQPMLTPEPQSTGVDSVEVLPTPLPEDRMFPEVSEQPLLCTNSVNLTPGCGLQDLRSKEFSPGPCFQTVRAKHLKPGSQSQLQTQPATGFKRMTLDLKNHVTEMTVLTCNARQQGKEFLRVTSTPVNRETECAEKSPRPYPQDLEPVVVSSKKRSPREQSVVSPPRPFYHVPDSAPGITPGPQIPESVGLTSKPWLQMEEFLELSAQQSSQVVGNLASVELTFKERQTEEVVSHLTKPQNASIEKASITLVESLDQIINLVRISPKPLDQVTESAKTQLQVPQSVSEYVTVMPGPPLQVIESVMIPDPTSQGSKYVDLTPKLHDVIISEFAPRLWLQNVQSKKLIAEPTHQILETLELPGFHVIKTVLLPKPLLLMVKSEELAPGPSPQAVEPIGVATRSRIKVNESLNLLPRPHLQDKLKPIEQTRRANIQENFTELILQQTSPLEEPPVLPHKQRLQAERCVGIKTEFPKVLETDLNQGRVCQNRDSEMITSEKLQAENYFSRFVSSPPIPFISSSAKTTELGPLQGSGMPEVSRALTMKNFNVGTLQSPESSTDTIMIRPTALPLVLPSDETGNSRGTLYPEIWGVDVITKEATEKKQTEEFGNSLQSYYPNPLRLLPSEFQAGLGARRNSIRSSLGRQLNIWESHVYRQRLPRKYLSNMLMLGNVLGTTMERMLCSQPFVTEGTTMDICQLTQNLFGVPAELMEFSQILLERGPRTISQTSMVKNYIQRRILWHGHEKRMPLKMWARGSTSSIIQQYSGTRLGLKKTNSKLSDIFQEVTQHVPVSCTGAVFPALGKPESPFGRLYDREDPVSRESSKNSQSDSQTRTSESHSSHKGSYFSQTETDLSEQSQLLKYLQLKVAEKLLQSQIPLNVPPPPESGLVLKYPICLQCGRCSGFRCCPKLQSDSEAYLLIYPKIHLKSTPEGRDNIGLHFGFRLQIRKRPQVSKSPERNRADTWKNPASPSRREAKISTPASKSPTSTRDFQPRSSQSPASVQVHRRQKHWGSLGVAGKTEAKDPGQYDLCEYDLFLSESSFERNRAEKWAKSRLRKTSELYKNSRPTEKNPSGTRNIPSRSRNMGTARTSTVCSKRQPKKSSQPKFIQKLFQGLKQAFQRACGMTAITGQKPEDRTSPDSLWSSKNLNLKENDEDDCLTGDGKGASTPFVKQMIMDSTPKQEDRLQETGDQVQQPKQVSALQTRALELKNMVPDVVIQATSTLQPMNIVQNSRAKNCEISSPESKNCSKVGAKEQEQDGFFRDLAIRNCNKSSETPFEMTNYSLSERPHQRRHSPQRKPRSASDRRTLRNLSERRHRSPAQRKNPSPSRRTPESLSDRSPPKLSKERGRNPSGRSQPSPSGRKSSNSSESSTHSSPRERRGHNPSPKTWLGLYGMNQQSPPIQRSGSPSKRSHLSPTQRTQASPSERRHSNPSERPPSRSSGRSPHSSTRSSPRERRGHNPSPKTWLGLYGMNQQSPPIQRSGSPSKRSHLSPTQRTQASSSKRSHSNPSERPPSRPSGRSPHTSTRSSPRERRGHNPSPKTWLGLYGMNQQSPPIQRSGSPSKRSHLSPTQRTQASSSKRSHSNPSERPPSRPSGRSPHTSTRSSPRERRGHNPSPKTWLGLYGMNQQSPPIQRSGSPSKRSHLSPTQRTQASPSERRHSISSERPPSRSSGRSPHSSTRSSLRERRGHNPSPKTWLGLYGMNQQSPPIQRSGSPSKRSHLSPTQRTQASPSERRHSISSETPPSRSSGRSPHSSTRSSLRERRGHNPSPKTWLGLYGMNQQSPPIQRSGSPSKRSHLSPTQRTQASPSERRHSISSETPPSRPSGTKRHSSSGRGYRSPSRSSLHSPSSGLDRSYSPRSHYSPSESRGLEKNQQGHHSQSHHARPHNSPKGRLQHSSPEERLRQSLSKEFKTY